MLVVIVQADLKSGTAIVKEDSLEIGWFTKEELQGLDYAFPNSAAEIKLLS
jgi:hypothetical protein